MEGEGIISRNGFITGDFSKSGFLIIWKVLGPCAVEGCCKH